MAPQCDRDAAVSHCEAGMVVRWLDRHPALLGHNVYLDVIP